MHSCLLRIFCLMACLPLLWGCSFDPLAMVRQNVVQEEEKQEPEEPGEGGETPAPPVPAEPLFAFSAERLAFPMEGGSQEVKILTDSASWILVSQPDWCEIAQREDAFTVTVPSGEAAREGFVTLLGTFPAGGTKEASLRVSQAGPMPSSFAMTFEGLTAWEETWQRGGAPETTGGEELTQVQLYCTNGHYTLLAAGLSRYVFFLNWGVEGTPPPLDKDMQSTEYHEQAESYTILVSGKGAAETAGESLALTYRLEIEWLDHPSPKLRFEARYEYGNSDAAHPLRLTSTEKASLSLTQFTPLL